MAARCTTPAAAMHHFGGMGAPFQRWLCTIICGQVALFERRTHEDWDSDEIYFVYDELRPHFPALTFESFSHCTALLTLRK